MAGEWPRHVGPSRAIPEPGFVARYYADCLRCDHGIVPGQRVTYTRGAHGNHLIHVGCASGQDDA